MDILKEKKSLIQETDNKNYGIANFSRTLS